MRTLINILVDISPGLLTFRNSNLSKNTCNSYGLIQFAKFSVNSPSGIILAVFNKCRPAAIQYHHFLLGLIFIFNDFDILMSKT